MQINLWLMKKLGHVRPVSFTLGLQEGNQWAYWVRSSPSEGVYKAPNWSFFLQTRPLSQIILQSSFAFKSWYGHLWVSCCDSSPCWQVPLRSRREKNLQWAQLPTAPLVPSCGCWGFVCSHIVPRLQGSSEWSGWVGLGQRKMIRGDSSGVMHTDTLWERARNVGSPATARMPTLSTHATWHSRKQGYGQTNGKRI